MTTLNRATGPVLSVAVALGVVSAMPGVDLAEGGGGIGLLDPEACSADSNDNKPQPRPTPSANSRDYFNGCATPTLVLMDVQLLTAPPAGAECLADVVKRIAS